MRCVVSLERRLTTVLWLLVLLLGRTQSASSDSHTSTTSPSVSPTLQPSGSIHRTTHSASRDAPSSAPTNAPSYSGPPQPASSPTIVTSTQTLINAKTSSGLALAHHMATQYGTVPLAGNETVDALLAHYYTWGAAYNLCRFLTFHAMLEAHLGVPQPTQFATILEALPDHPMNVIRSSRNATCNVSHLFSVSVAILTQVPQSAGNPPLYPSTFTCFVMVRGSYASSVVSMLSNVLSSNYVPPYRPLDLIETIGFDRLTYNSPPPPTPTSVAVYAVTKDSPISTSSGVAVWTFLLVQVLAICGAVVIGMTLVRWLIKPPQLPPLKERIMCQEDSLDQTTS